MLRANALYLSVLSVALFYSANGMAADTVSRLAGDVNTLSKDLSTAVHVAGDTLLLTGGAADNVGGAVVETTAATGAFTVNTLNTEGEALNATGDLLAEEGVAGLPVAGTVTDEVVSLADGLLADGAGGQLGGVTGTVSSLTDDVTGTVNNLTGDLATGDLLGGVTDTVGTLTSGVTGGIAGGSSAGASGNGSGSASASAGGGLLGTGLLAN